MMSVPTPVAVIGVQSELSPMTTVQRLEKLDEAEESLVAALETAQSFLSDLGNEKPPVKRAADLAVKELSDRLKNVGEILLSQVDYLGGVCVGATHEGTTFPLEQQRRLAEMDANYMLQALNEMKNAERALASSQHDGDVAQAEPTGSA